MKKTSFILITITIIVSVIFGCCYFRWKHLWGMERPLPMYKVEINNDDTIRVLVLGDSWAAMHNSMDSFEASLSTRLPIPSIQNDTLKCLICKNCNS